MKGVILAGGRGTRLRPLTDVTNKHLLPVYDRPMIYYPIELLVASGIDDIVIVTGADYADDFRRLLGDGERLGVRRLTFARQEGNGGIADALNVARGIADAGKICVVLGDNVIDGDLAATVRRFAQQRRGARVLLKEVADPRGFGIARFAGNGPESTILEVVEKPESSPSRYAVIGVYFFHSDVFDICAGLRPSARGELEITDVLNAYAARGELEHEVLEHAWVDAGTFDGLLGAAQLAAGARSRSRPGELCPSGHAAGAATTGEDA